jgi:hypothetical protein
MSHYVHKPGDTYRDYLKHIQNDVCVDTVTSPIAKSSREIVASARQLAKENTIDVKVVVQFIMRIDQAARLAICSRERWETGLRVVERTGDQLRVRRPFLRSGWRSFAVR